MACSRSVWWSCFVDSGMPLPCCTRLQAGGKSTTSTVAVLVRYRAGSQKLTRAAPDSTQLGVWSLVPPSLALLSELGNGWAGRAESDPTIVHKHTGLWVNS